VTAEMLESVLRIFVKPVVFTHIVLRSTDKSRPVQPLASDRCQEPMPFDNTIAFACQGFTFSLADLETIRDTKGEFLITVIGVGEVPGPSRYSPSPDTTPVERDFTIKTKHFKDLP